MPLNVFKMVGHCVWPLSALNYFAINIAQSAPTHTTWLAQFAYLLPVAILKQFVKPSAPVSL
jgi:hypothetical protein